MGIRTKKELLEHYSKAEIREFIQFDAFADSKMFDSVVIPSKDGIAYMSSISSELMNSDFTIRILIKPDTKKEIIRTALIGIMGWIRHSYSEKSFKSQSIKEITEDYHNNKVGFISNKV